MLCDDRIVWSQLVRLFKFNSGFFVVTQFKIDPTQTIGDIAHIGFEGHCFLDQFKSLIEMDTPIRIGIAQVVEGIRVIGIQSEDLLHLDNHFLKVSHLIVDRAQLKKEIHILLVFFKPHLQRGQSFLQLVLFLEKVCKDKIEISFLRFSLNRFLHNANRLFRFVLFF